jgi:hypothetical protein
LGRNGVVGVAVVFGFNPAGLVGVVVAFGFNPGVVVVGFGVAVVVPRWTLPLPPVPVAGALPGDVLTVADGVLGVVVFGVVVFTGLGAGLAFGVATLGVGVALGAGAALCGAACAVGAG